MQGGRQPDRYLADLMIDRVAADFGISGPYRRRGSGASRKRTPMPDNTERNKEVIAQWQAGLSSGEIARRHPGMTRNAVIGVISRARAKRGAEAVNDRRARRLKGTKRATGVTKPTRQAHIAYEAPPPPKQRKPWTEEPIPAHIEEQNTWINGKRQNKSVFKLAVESGGVLFGDRAPDQCAFPVSDDDEPLRCCGGECVEGRPYCERHCHAAYVKPHARGATSYYLPRAVSLTAIGRAVNPR